MAFFGLILSSIYIYTYYVHLLGHGKPSSTLHNHLSEYPYTLNRRKGKLCLIKFRVGLSLNMKYYCSNRTNKTGGQSDRVTRVRLVSKRMIFNVAPGTQNHNGTAAPLILRR